MKIVKLLRNSSTSLASISLLSLTMFASAGMAFFAQLLLARQLGVSSYGAFTTALTIILLVSALGGFGVPEFLLRVFGISGRAAEAWLKPSLKLVFLSCSVLIAGIFIWANYFLDDPLIKTTLFVLLPVVFVAPLSELSYALLQLEANYRRLALLQMLPNLIRCLVAGLALILSMNLWRVSILLSLLSTLSIIIYILMFLKILRGRLDLAERYLSIDVQKSKAKVRGYSITNVLRGAWPYGLASIFYLIYYQSDIILLGLLVGSEAAGIYNVAFAIMNAIYLLPNVIYQKYLLPKLHNWAEHDKPRFLKTYHQGNKLMLGLSLIVLLALIFNASWFIDFAFGLAYENAVKVLWILAFCIPSRYVASSVGGVLVTQNHMRRKVWLMGLTAVLNIILNLILIPKYSFYGAAISTLICQTLLLALYYWAAETYVIRKPA